MRMASNNSDEAEKCSSSFNGLLRRFYRADANEICRNEFPFETGRISCIFAPGEIKGREH